jgi:hypothetical protein
MDPLIYWLLVSAYLLYMRFISANFSIRYFASGQVTVREDTPLSGTQIIELSKISSYFCVLKLYFQLKTGLKQLQRRILWGFYMFPVEPSTTAKTQFRKFETNIPRKGLRSLSPNFHIHVSVSDLYIPTILLQENMWTRLKWFSQLDGIHEQKAAKKYSLKCLLKKFFNWLSHFLRICIILFPKNTHICTPWPQHFFYFFFNIWVSKKCRILRWFQIRENILKKVYLEKVICQKLLQVIIIAFYTYIPVNLFHFLKKTS